MIRILHVVAKMNLGGTETFLMNIYRNIDRSKVQFDFLTYYDNNESGYFDEEIIKLGGKIHNLDSIKKSGPIKAILNIRNLIKKENYKIVHAHTTYSIGFSMIAAYLEKVPLRIAHSHNTGTGDESIKNKLYAYIMKFIIKKLSNNLCACSKKAAYHLFDNKPFILLPNAVELSKFINLIGNDTNNLKNELLIPCDAKIIGHVGRFGKAKNHEFIIDIFSKFLEKNSNAILILVGDGKNKYDIEEKAKQLNIYENIRFLGLRNDVDKIMSLFDIFILPSNYEGFGIVLLEAQASGLPCIVSQNIQPEVDLGLNLVKWVNLNDEDKWIDNINYNLDNKIKDKNIIKEKLKNSMFQLQNVVNKFYTLYGAN